MTMGGPGKDLSPPVITGLLRVADLLVIALAAFAAHLLRFQNADMPGSYILVVLVVLLIAANVFHGFRLYRFAALTEPLFQVRKLFLAWVLVGLVVVAMGFLTKASADYSRLWVVAWGSMAFVGLCILRFGVRLRLVSWQRQGRLSRRYAVVGAGEQGHRIVRFLKEHPDAGLELVGVFDDRTSRVPKTVEGVPLKGTVDDLLATVRSQRIDSIVVALPWLAEDRLLEILYRLKTIPVDVHLCPEGIAYRFPSRPFHDLRGMNMLSVLERPMSNWDAVVKGLEDRILAALVLFFVLPLLGIIALAIKLDSRGPVFFRQRRYGFNNELIEVYKFRTMYHERADATAEHLATRDDPRVTPLGAFLRRSSLDELPQFINVLKGDMSIVGPRPHATSAKAAGTPYEYAVAAYAARHRVKPGITGWAQVNGWRGETDTIEKIENRVKYDLFYIDNWSLALDLKIILMTFGAILKGENAY